MDSEPSPHYLRIALCIAGRIVQGSYCVGEKLSGQSTLSTEYAVSPETIRRAMCLLSDMKIVSSQRHGGTVVLSADNAARFLAEYREKQDTDEKMQNLRKLFEQQSAVSKQIAVLCEEIVRENARAAQDDSEISIYEVKVPEASWIVGKNLLTVRFWSHTEATIVAIRRKGHLILSPGPLAELYSGDWILFVGKVGVVEKVETFLQRGGGRQVSATGEAKQ